MVFLGNDVTFQESGRQCHRLDLCVLVSVNTKEVLQFAEFPRNDVAIPAIRDIFKESATPRTGQRTPRTVKRAGFRSIVILFAISDGNRAVYTHADGHFHRELLH